MRTSATNASTGNRRGETGVLDEPPSWRLNVAFQLSLAWLLAGLVWKQFGPELENGFDFRLQLFVIGSGVVTSITLWMAGSRWKPLAKMAVVAASLAAVSITAVKSAREFDASLEVLKPPRVTPDRIVHPALGLSYAKLPGYRIDLKPVVALSESRQAAGGAETASRLLPGDSAIVCRMEQETKSPESGHEPATITLQIQPNSATETNLFVRGVRQMESEIAAFPNMHIVRKTRRFRTAALEMAEFEFVIEPHHRMARNVCLRAGAFLVTIMFQTSNESDRVVFDEFLNSIRLESAP